MDVDVIPVQRILMPLYLYMFFFVSLQLYDRDQLYWANTTDLRPVAGLGSVPLIFYSIREVRLNFSSRIILKHNNERKNTSD